jgi:hypothetical protein
MSLKLNSSGGGSVTLSEPVTATNGTLTLPAGTGNVTVNGLSSNIVSGTAVASTSGTSIDFTGIPSWVKRVTVMFSGVSTNGSSAPLIQIGSGSVTTSGYNSSGSNISSGASTASSTAGFIISSGAASGDARSGSFILTNITGNIWTMQGVCFLTTNFNSVNAGTSSALSGALDRVRITTVNGTDTFDAGTINILYE